MNGWKARVHTLPVLVCVLCSCACPPFTFRSPARPHPAYNPLPLPPRTSTGSRPRLCARWHVFPVLLDLVVFTSQRRPPPNEKKQRFLPFPSLAEFVLHCKAITTEELTHHTLHAHTHTSQPQLHPHRLAKPWNRREKSTCLLASPRRAEEEEEWEG